MIDYTVGDKVVALKTIQRRHFWHYWITPIEKGTVLTVRSLTETDKGWIGVLFTEVVNVVKVGKGRESAYRASLFRKVITTDISDLQAIARKVFDKARVDA